MLLWSFWKAIVVQPNDSTLGHLSQRNKTLGLLTSLPPTQMSAPRLFARAKPCTKAPHRVSVALTPWKWYLAIKTERTIDWCSNLREFPGNFAE